MKKHNTPRPFIKWVGGKRQLLKDLTKRLPKDINTYHEPFVGGGALFFELYRNNRFKNAIISDTNAELIDTYIAIRDHAENVIEILATYPHDESFFYALRTDDPWQMDIEHRAARMIYLNKTCYNGLYRVNKQGKFNAPFGRYKSPTYNDPENLRAVSDSLQNIEIICTSFETVLKKAARGDFVYFDPPYVPLSATANFTSYQSGGFGLQAQEELRDVCLSLTKKHVNLMLSNSATEIVKALYVSPKFKIAEVSANRAINSNPKKRGKLNELLVTNYSVRNIKQLKLVETKITSSGELPLSASI